MKYLCKELGIFECSACWFYGDEISKDQRIQLPYNCSIVEYENKLSPGYIKYYVCKLMNDYDGSSRHFYAALQRNPSMLELYNKLVLLM
jgi:hypothetical protein